MSIKIKLIILAVVSLLVTGTVGFILFQNTVSVRKEIEKQGIISEIQNKTFERAILRDDYFLYHEERPITQLEIISKDLDKLLIQASEQGLKVDILDKNKKFIDQTFSKVIAGSPSTELEQSLESQIVIKSQENIVISTQLADASRNKVTEGQQRIIFFVLLFIAGISLIIIAAIYLVWRSIGEPLIVLKDAAARIAALDFFSTTTTTTGNGGGELGELGRAFNQMVVKLRESYASLKNRTQDLQNANIATQNVLEDLNIEKSKLEIAKAKDEAILGGIGDGIFVIDKTGIIIIFNKVAEDISGWSTVEALGKQYGKILKFATEDKPDVIKNDFISQALVGKKIQMANHAVIIRKDGTKLPVADSAAPILDNAGKVQAVVVVFRDVTKDRAVDKAKTEFVSLASHQLRTPLGIMKWYLEALENESYLQKAPKQTKEYFDEIYKSNERVLSLVRDLLSVSRIEQGRIKDVPTAVNTIQVVKEVVELMRIVASKKKVALTLTIKDQKIPAINIDALRFREVIENLIVNAIEYSLSADKVFITVNRLGDTFSIGVKDTGIGISEADQKNLFTKFFRSEKAVEHNPEGSGLGLYVVKSYVEGWGGSISVKSAEGEGSTFTISLPITQKKDILKGESKL